MHGTMNLKKKYKTCHLAVNNLQPFERPTGECCIAKQDMIIKHWYKICVCG